MQTFKQYIAERVADIKVKTKPKVKKGSHRLKTTRGMDRKNLRMVPNLYRAIQGGGDRMGDASHKVINIAKKSSRGIWKITKRQVIDIANKYKFHIPNDQKSTKHLGSTGIIMYRKAPGVYFLVKPYSPTRG